MYLFDFVIYISVPQPVCGGTLVCRHKVKGVPRIEKVAQH
jgi:hypothetical protein